jgi:hypothetical protein
VSSFFAAYGCIHMATKTTGFGWGNILFRNESELLEQNQAVVFLVHFISIQSHGEQEQDHDLVNSCGHKTNDIIYKHV